MFILDWDVHHGNGTAEAFRRRSDVLFASIHQSGIYPGTGPLSDVGSGPGEGYTINLPVPAGSEEDLWLSLIEHIVLPAAEQFEPELVLISAGFDAHRDDPLAGCRLRERAPSRRWPATCATSPMSSACRSGRSSRAAMNPWRWRSPCGTTLIALGGERAGAIRRARAAADLARRRAHRPLLVAVSRTA